MPWFDQGRPGHPRRARRRSPRLDCDGARDALANGELGAAVSEDDLGGAIVRLLATPKPHPRALAARTPARFSRAVFDAREGMAFDEILSPA